MKKKVGYILVLPLLSVFLITEVNNLNGKEGTFDSSKGLTDLPYILDNSNTIGIVPNSETQNSAKLEVTVHDNEAQDFYNASIDNTAFLWWDDLYQDNEIYSSISFLPEETNIDNNKYVFSIESVDMSSGNHYQLLYIFETGFTYGRTGDTLISKLYVDGSTPPPGEENVSLKTITDVSFYASSYTMEDYPEIDSSGVGNEDPIYNINYIDGELTFQLSGENLENTSDGNLDIVLKDSEGNYDTYEAIATDQSTNTYSITGLSDSSYEFVSIINSGLTIDPDGNNETYTPMSTVNFVDDLGMEETSLTVLPASSPYVVDEGLTITDSATISSIQFTLNVIDNVNGDFKSTLTENDNILNVTLSINGESTASYQAIWQEDSTNDIYTFEIDNLDPETNYEIVSLDNSGLAVGDSNLAIDDQILVVDELHSDGTFVTDSEQTAIVNDDSFNLLWLLIPLILIIIISAGAGTYFFKNKKGKA